MNKPVKESPTVLVVEADPEIRFYLRRCLGSLPAPVPRVHEAENVDQAIREFAEENNLAVILDMFNPQVGLVLAAGTIDITAAIGEYIENPVASEGVP